MRTGFWTSGWVACAAVLLVWQPDSDSVLAADEPGRSFRRIRIATYNTSLHRQRTGELIADLEQGDDPQARRIAGIIQHVRPDLLLVNEFDCDPSGRAVETFHSLYLARSQFDQEPIQFRDRFLAPVNTGVPTGHDLDASGDTNGPNDAFGFGRYPGQYGMVVFSSLPIDRLAVRTFQMFLWKDMPDAQIPQRPDGKAYYAHEAWNQFRLSSKSHWDVPVRVGDSTLHFLVSHPTPPAFDGPEFRNRLRNHDEIRFWSDYIDSARSGYIYDDQGQRGGLTSSSLFVIAGDQNADPDDGSSFNSAARMLTEHSLIAKMRVPASQGAIEASVNQAELNQPHKGNSASDTADFSFPGGPGNLRVDYVLPSSSLKVVDSGVFWPKRGEWGADLVTASDHRLVWIDVELPPKPDAAAP